MMKLETKLEEYAGQEIAVVMADGRCFKGRLRGHDDRILVMSDVAETTNAEIDWSVKERIGGHAGSAIEWRRVALPETVIMLRHVLRIWPWKTSPVKDVKPEVQVVSRMDNVPVYHIF